MDGRLNGGWTYQDVVKAGGETVLNFYARRYRHSSEREWRSRIEQGLVLLDGQAVGAERVLAQGEKLTYRRLPWREPMVPLNFGVLYEDEDLWAIDKPSGLQVLPGGGFSEHTLLGVMRSRYPNERPAPVHRLGRGTSGVMLVAKSVRAKVDLARQFRDRTRLKMGAMCKVYRALVGPTTEAELPKQFVCEEKIGKVPYPLVGYVYACVKDGMSSRSEGRVLARRADETLVEMTIFTGRPHQIRLHLAAAGHPLLGDPLYVAGGGPKQGDGAVPGDCGYCLHAHQIQFAHPGSGALMMMTAPLPPRLKEGE